jgi:hypothetical protein
MRLTHPTAGEAKDARLVATPRQEVDDLAQSRPLEIGKDDDGGGPEVADGDHGRMVRAQRERAMN